MTSRLIHSLLIASFLATTAVFADSPAAAPAQGAVVSPSAAKADVSQEEIQAAVAQVKPSLVRIKVVEPEYYQGRENKGVAFGSGTIVSADGYVVTNHHVAGKAVQIVCTMSNREEVPARLIGTDPATDIAVIKLEPEQPREFPVAKFGDSETVKVGDPVLALGSPLAISQSVTLGILANAEMITPPSFRGESLQMDGESVGDLVRWLGHDAAIFPGNSGGPLVNLSGEIIGVNEIGLGLGGAIPGNLAKAVVQDIINHGKVKRAYVGVSIQPRLLSSPLDKGVLIASVQKNSPGEKAGFKPGDILLAVNSTPVEGRFAEEIPAINNIVAHLPVGQPARIDIYRAGENKTIEVTPEEREAALLPTHELRAWGITGRNVSLWTKIDLALESKKGVIVTSTRPGGPASKGKPELKESDVILEVNGKAIDSIESLEEATKSIVGDKEVFVPTLVLFEREGEKLLTVVDIGIDKLQDPGKEVQKSWLPIETQPLTREIAKQLGIPKVKGVRVTRVFDSKPEGFPLEVGDVITHFDKEELDISKPVDSDVFETLVRQYPLESEVPLKLLRGKETKEVSLKLGTSPKQSREMKRYRDLDFEFVVRESTFSDKSRPTLKGAEFGVVIDGVTQGGWADLAGLGVGDALLEINGKAVSTAADVEAQMKAAKAAKLKHVVFFVRRGSQSIFLELQPKWS